MKAAGAKQRHIERCRYMPQKKAVRKVRITRGMQQTYKLRGDIVIINPTVKSFTAPRRGWY